MRDAPTCGLQVYKSSRMDCILYGCPPLSVNPRILQSLRDGALLDVFVYGAMMGGHRMRALKVARTPRTFYSARLAMALSTWPRAFKDLISRVDGSTICLVRAWRHLERPQAMHGRSARILLSTHSCITSAWVRLNALVAITSHKVRFLAQPPLRIALCARLPVAVPLLF